MQLHLHGAPFDLIVRPGSLASAQAAPRSLDEILCPHADYCERTPAGRRILLPCSSTTAPSRCTSSVSLQVIVDWLRWPESVTRRLLSWRRLSVEAVVFMSVLAFGDKSRGVVPRVLTDVNRRSGGSRRPCLVEIDSDRGSNLLSGETSALDLALRDVFGNSRWAWEGGVCLSVSLSLYVRVHGAYVRP